MTLWTPRRSVLRRRSGILRAGMRRNSGRHRGALRGFAGIDGANGHPRLCLQASHQLQDAQSGNEIHRSMVVSGSLLLVVVLAAVSGRYHRRNATTTRTTCANFTRKSFSEIVNFPIMLNSYFCTCAEATRQAGRLQPSVNGL